MVSFVLPLFESWGFSYGRIDDRIFPATYFTAQQSGVRAIYVFSGPFSFSMSFFRLLLPSRSELESLFGGHYLRGEARWYSSQGFFFWESVRIMCKARGQRGEEVAGCSVPLTAPVSLEGAML